MERFYTIRIGFDESVTDQEVYDKLNDGLKYMERRGTITSFEVVDIGDTAPGGQDAD